MISDQYDVIRWILIFLATVQMVVCRGRREKVLEALCWWAHINKNRLRFWKDKMTDLGLSTLSPFKDIQDGNSETRGIVLSVWKVEHRLGWEGTAVKTVRLTAGIFSALLRYKRQNYNVFMVVVVQSPSHVPLFVTTWTTACQASLSFTISWSLTKFMSIESVMPSNRLILWCPLLLLPSIFPSIRIFSNELALHISWPKYWNFSLSISPFNE